jgi:uncharacterized protein (TIGR03437 family)
MYKFFTTIRANIRGTEKEMTRFHATRFGKTALALTALPVALWAFSRGPLVRHTGAPGDRTCQRCHAGTEVGNQVTITWSGGTTYVPGQTGRFTVTTADTEGRARYGMQASARLMSNLENGQAGTLIAGSGQRVICGDPDVACTSPTQAQFLEHTAPSQSPTFEFEWTPPAAGAGDVRLYVAMNAANGNGSAGGDRIHTANIMLSPAATGGARPAISQGGVVDPWTRKTGVAPGTWVEIYGQNFGTGTTDWSNAIVNGMLPTTLAGVSVTIDNKPAAISLVAPGQVNALVPANAGTGDVAVRVRTPAGESDPMTIRLTSVSPVVFAPTQNGDRYTAFLVDNSTGVLYGASPAARPARPGDIVQLYALGLGATNPALVTDRVLPAPASLVNAPTVRFGETQADVLGSALISPGLYQINLRVPDVNGELPLTIETSGVRSPNNTIILVQRP